jgi:hypothetical protein
VINREVACSHHAVNAGPLGPGPNCLQHLRDTHVASVTKLLGWTLADLGFVLIDMAIYAAVLCAVVWGFLHFPIQTAILVGALIIAGAVVYSSRRRLT